VTGSIADVGARLVLTGRTEFTGGIDAAKKAVLDLGTANKNTAATSKDAAASSDKQAASAKKVADTSTAAAGSADKLAAAQKRVAASTAELAAAQREYEESMALGAVTGADAVASADLQVEALNRVKRAEAEVALAAKDSAKVQADAAAASADATVASADKSVAADAKAGEGAKAKGAMSKGALLGIVAAGVGLGYESIKLATGFETQMTRLTTAAGMPKPIVDASKQAVIDLGTQTGFTGTQMAEALYHPISAGLDMATSLNVVRDSAKEAKISGADLDHTTFSLSSVMKAFGVGAEGSAQTMATLNAIVGQGDMRFEDFNTSVKGWAAPAATFGVSVQSVGAALAYMTDRGVPAAQAGTQLGMSMTLMAAPTKQATKILQGVNVPLADITKAAGPMRDALKKAGVSTTQMADDMRKPDGIKVALQDLKDHLISSGTTADGAAAVIARAFGGGKSGKAIMSLIGNLDGLQQKYDAIGADSTPEKFAAAWEQTKNTTKFQLDSLKASFENFGIKIGSVLLPYVDKMIAGFSKFFGFLSENKTAMLVFAGVVGVLLVSAFVALGISIIQGTWEIILIVGAIAGLAAGFMYLWNHVEGFRNFWKAVWADISGWVTTAWTTIKQIFDEIKFGWAVLRASFTMGADVTSGGGGIIGLMSRIGVAVRQVVDWVKAHWPEIKAIASQVWHDVYAVVSTVISDFIKVIDAIVTWIRDHWSQISAIAKGVWDVVSAIVVGTVKVIYDVVTSVVGWIRDHWSEIKSVTKVIWDFVSTIVKDAIAVIVDIVKGIIAAVDWVIRTWQSISDSTAKFLAPIVDMIRSHWDEIKQVTEFVWNVIYTTVQVAWTEISAVFSVVWGVIKGIFDAFLPLIVGLLDVAWEVIKQAVQVAWDLIVGILRTAWDIIAGVFTTARDLLLGIISVLLDVLTGHWSKAWDDIKKYTGVVLNDVVDGIKNPLGDMLDAAKRILTDLYHGFADIAHAIWDTVTTTFKGGINGVLDLVNGFLGAVNKIAGAVGLNLNLHVDPIGSTGSAPSGTNNGTGLATGSSTAGLATGGVVPIDAGFITNGAQAVVGEGNPAHPEYVIPTDPAHRGRAMGLYSALGAQLAGGYMAEGGVLPALAGGGVLGDIVGGITGAASSAWSGIKDVAGAAASIAKEGLGKLLEAVWPKLPTPNNMLGIIPSGVNNTRDKVISYIEDKDAANKKAAAASSGGGAYQGGPAYAAGGAGVDGWIAEALGLMGMPPTFIPGIHSLIMSESSGNPNAINLTDSNATAGHPSQGLMQTIPTTYAAYVLPSLASRPITDPVSNITAGVRYALANYGPGMLMGGGRHGAGGGYVGYETGGIFGMDPQTAFEHRFMGGPVNSGQPYVVGERGPEVFVPTTAGVIVPAAGGAGGGGGSSSTVTTSSSTVGARTVNVAAGAIVIHESSNPQATYEAVKQALQDEVARR